LAQPEEVTEFIIRAASNDRENQQGR
jgi:hypothetical protein